MTDHSMRERVLHWVAQIPPGKVATYGQIAALAGHPRAPRQVGGILHSLKDPAIPWHRVVNAQGGISTWKVGSGEVQLARLQAEGVVFDAQAHCDLQRYLWNPNEAIAIQKKPRKQRG